MKIGHILIELVVFIIIVWSLTCYIFNTCKDSDISADELKNNSVGFSVEPFTDEELEVKGISRTDHLMVIRKDGSVSEVVDFTKPSKVIKKSP